MLSLLSYDFMQRAFLAVIAMSLFSSSWNLPYLASSESHEWYPQSRFSIRVAFGPVLEFLQRFQPLLLSWLQRFFWSISVRFTRTLWKSGLPSSCRQGLQSPLSWWVRGKVRVPWVWIQYLFGSIVTISQEQVIFLFAIAAVVLLLTFLFLRPMYILTFDEDMAFVDGLPVRTMSILFNMVTGWLLPLWFQLRELFWCRPLWSCQLVLPFV